MEEDIALTKKERRALAREERRKVQDKVAFTAKFKRFILWVTALENEAKPGLGNRI